MTAWLNGTFTNQMLGSPANPNRFLAGDGSKLLTHSYGEIKATGNPSYGRWSLEKSSFVAGGGPMWTNTNTCVFGPNCSPSGICGDSSARDYSLSECVGTNNPTTGGHGREAAISAVNGSIQVNNNLSAGGYSEYSPYYLGPAHYGIGDTDDKWITLDTALKCCADPTTSSSAAPCNPGYNRDTQKGCQNLMLDYCSNNWDDQVCTQYAQAYQTIPDATSVVRTTLVNYINSRSPPDYTSKKLDNNAVRDDSTDPFFTSVVPTICSYAKGACDCVLNQYCAQFGRADMTKDDTLRVLCGCHMSQTPTAPLTCGNDADKLNLRNTTVLPNQYTYPETGVMCDPMCKYSGTMENNAFTPCEESVCIIDNVNVNLINSSSEVDLSQACGTPSGGVSSCYIGDVDVNDISSEGKVKLAENCGKCYRYIEGDIPQVIECNTLQPAATLKPLIPLEPPLLPLEPAPSATTTPLIPLVRPVTPTPEPPAPKWEVWVRTNRVPLIVTGAVLLLAAIIAIVVFIVRAVRRRV